MLELERLRPGVETLFFQACGADQNPIPRGTVDHCRRYGESLAKAVHRALDEPTRPLAPTFRAAYERAELNFKTPLTLEFLKAKSAEASPLGAISARHLDRVAQGEPLPTSHPYAVQAWKLGDDQLWIALSGEAVVDYSLKYKARYGERAWVAGYAHDLVCYIPSTRILKEGGGQEPGVPWDYGIPNREWADDIEDRIDAAVARLVESTLATQPRARTIPEDR